MALRVTTGLYLCVIFTATSLPGGSVPLRGVGSDKPAHLLAFVVLGALLALSIRAERARRLRGAALALAIAWTYAILDEWHQRWIPSRSASWGDVAADWIGATVGILAVATLSPLEDDPDDDTADPADQ